MESSKTGFQLLKNYNKDGQVYWTFTLSLNIPVHYKPQLGQAQILSVQPRQASFDIFYPFEPKPSQAQILGFLMSQAKPSKYKLSNLELVWFTLSWVYFRL